MTKIKTYADLKNISLKGRRFEYTYLGSGMRGQVVFDDEKANWLILGGPNKGMSGSDSYRALTVSAGIFFIMWHEPADNITVVLTINENSKTVFAAVASPSEVEFDVAKFSRTDVRRR